MSDELKPCPMCGCQEIDVRSRKTTIVECKSCGLMMFDYRDGVVRDVIAAWNTRRPTPEQSGETRERAASDALTLVGHAEYLRGMGQSDMPSWFLGLAERIARGAGLMTLADRCAAMDRSALGREE